MTVCLFLILQNDSPVCGYILQGFFLKVGTEENDDEEGANKIILFFIIRFIFLLLHFIRNYVHLFGSCKKGCCFLLSGVNAFLNAPFLKKKYREVQFHKQLELFRYEVYISVITNKMSDFMIYYSHVIKLF